ncbi:hypothetical protein C8Q76DRAFT_695701 [Earliella scabrosa]|nr:hypothetical protein C8Q76DRAFT_695701 [Earliella scabrosa]
MNSAGPQIIRKRNLIYADSAHLDLNGNWFRRQVTTPDYETNVIATRELGAVAILGFTGYGVEVYGIESPNTTHNSTYIIDGGVPTVYSSRPRDLKEDVDFFWSQSLLIRVCNFKFGFHGQKHNRVVDSPDYAYPNICNSQ